VLEKLEEPSPERSLDDTIWHMVKRDAGETPLLPEMPNWWSRGRPVIFCTDAGFVGLGPAHTAPGDEVALIDETFIPAVLTPVQDTGHVFRGYAYVPLLPFVSPEELKQHLYTLI
jgi:hypothetical protein